VHKFFLSLLLATAFPVMANEAQPVAADPVLEARVRKIAEEAGLDLSSASIRSILQELENEGYLHQAHTSAGREPTDKGYRFFVDYLSGVQRLAASEKESIEEQYKSRIEELDTLLSETSRLLSRVSHGAGIVLSPHMGKQAIKRLELLPLGGRNVLGVLITDSGLVRHWPIQLAFAPSARQVNMLNRFLNENIRGVSVDKAQGMVLSKLTQMEREFAELTSLAGELLTEVGRVTSPESIYVEGADNILSRAEQFGDLKTVQSLMRVIGEKDRLALMLEKELEDDAAQVGVLEGGSLQVGGAEDPAHQSHRLVLHVGGKIGAVEVGAFQACASKVGGDARS